MYRVKPCYIQGLVLSVLSDIHRASWNLCPGWGAGRAGWVRGSYCAYTRIVKGFLASSYLTQPSSHRVTPSHLFLVRMLAVYSPSKFPSYSIIITMLEPQNESFCSWKCVPNMGSKMLRERRWTKTNTTWYRFYVASLQSWTHRNSVAARGWQETGPLSEAAELL